MNTLKMRRKAYFVGVGLIAIVLIFFQNCSNRFEAINNSSSAGISSTSNPPISNPTPNPSGPLSIYVLNSEPVTQGASVIFSVTLNKVSATPVVVSVQTQDSTAIAGSDYTAVNTSLTISAGSLTTSLSVPTLNYVPAVTTKTFNLIASNAAGVNISQASGAASIKPYSQLYQFKQIAVADDQNFPGTTFCGIGATDSLVRCWGSNVLGRMGQSSKSIGQSPLPVLVPGLGPAQSLALFGSGGCAVQTNGSVYCWGEEYSNVNISAVQIAGITNASAISAFGFFSNIYPDGSPCVLTNAGTVQCFSIAGVVNIAGLTGVTKVVALHDGGCALTNQNAIYCWSNSSPTAVEIASASDVVDFSAMTAIVGSTTILCYLNTAGSVSCAQSASLAPATFAPVQGLTNITSLGGDDTGLYAMNNTGTVYQLSGSAILATPIAIGSDSNAKSFSTAYGKSNICFLNNDQSIYCQGPSYSPTSAGRYVTPHSIQAAFVPVQIKSNDIFIQAQTQSSNYFVSACATTKVGTVDCWGDGFSATPTPVSGATNIQKVTFAAGATEFLSGTGLVFQELLSSTATSAIAQVPGLTSVTDITNGVTALALSGGNIFEWAPASPQTTLPTETTGAITSISSNSGYALDNAGNIKRSTLTGAAVNVPNATSVTSGVGHECVLTTAQVVYCWGSNDSGQTGQPLTTTNVSTPTLVSGLSNVVQISAGDNHTCALKSDGTVVCWGANYGGQLGNNSTVNSYLPVTPLNLPRVNSVSAAGAATTFVTTTGQVFISGWGVPAIFSSTPLGLFGPM